MFVIPMYNHQTTLFCFVLISSDILWNCFQILWLQLLKYTPEIYATLGPHSPGSHTCDGGWCLMGKTSYRHDTLPSLPFQWGVIMCTIASANIFVQKKKGKNAVWHHGFGSKKNKMEKVVVDEICGLKCLNNCRPNILLFFKNYSTRAKIQGHAFKQVVFPSCFIVSYQNKMT